MSRVIQYLLCFSITISLGHSACAPSDNPRCVFWKQNGFCNGAYAKDVIQKYCPTCAGSGCPNADPIPGVPKVKVPEKIKKPFVENKNCPKWATNVDGAFCLSDTIKDTMKSAYCKETCKYELKPTDDCVIYYSDKDGKVLKPKKAVAKTFNDVTGTTPEDIIQYVYVKTGQKLTLLDAADKAVGAVHNGDSKFKKLTADNIGVGKMKCE